MRVPMRNSARFALLTCVAVLLFASIAILLFAPAAALHFALANLSEIDGLPVPKSYTIRIHSQVLSKDDQTFRHELKASVEQPLPDVLAFYRRELGKRGWQEVGQQTPAENNIAADSAVLHFTTPKGLAVLNVTRAKDVTHVDLVVRYPEAVAKAGYMPKPGFARVMLGNDTVTAQTITFNNQPIEITGIDERVGKGEPSQDVPPGTYTYSVQLPGKPVQSDQIELHADETWELKIVQTGVEPSEIY
jgi:hypothetical protein